MIIELTKKEQEIVDLCTRFVKEYLLYYVGV